MVDTLIITSGIKNKESGCKPRWFGTITRVAEHLAADPDVVKEIQRADARLFDVPTAQVVIGDGELKQLDLKDLAIHHNGKEE